jgi:hypothetical protein
MPTSSAAKTLERRLQIRQLNQSQPPSLTRKPVDLIVLQMHDLQPNKICISGESVTIF